MDDTKLRVLMVDDSADDILFVRRALKEAGVAKFFRAVRDGQEAIRYLKGEGQYEDREANPFPNILLMDLKMPGMNGFGLLAWLKKHPDCGVIPTIVFTSSAIESDVRAAYEAGANAYIAKPNDLEELVRVINLMHTFWSICQRPTAPVTAKCV